MRRPEPTRQEGPTDGLLIVMREQGHEPQVSQINDQTGYVEARCARCNARGWGWYFPRIGTNRADMDGPGVTRTCTFA